ncbi:MAG: CHAT domain-containing protein, partial [Cyanobacteria bacterium P01_D01_bin.56]
MGHSSWQQLNRCILPIAGWLSTFTLGFSPAWGQITPIGNSVITHDGLNIQIQGGTPSADGVNLFHQFESFSISTPESVTFIAPTSIENILGRVSGGQASVIDGSLRSASEANLWLINPAGLLFGSNAQLDLQGDFTAATAYAVGFEQGWFSDDTNYQTLVGPPRSFAFLADSAHLVNLGNLQVAPGQNIQLLGGQVINAGTLSAPEGTITIAAIADTNRVNLSHTGQVLSLEIEPVTDEILTPDITPLDLPELLTGQGGEPADTLSINADGTLQLGQSTAFIPEAGDAIISDNLNTVGEQGGQVTVLGNRVALVDATIRAEGITSGGQIYIGGNYQGNGPLPNATQTIVNAGTVLNADALEQGNGGEIIVWADNTTSFGGTATARGGHSRGDGGFIEISGKSNLEFTGRFDVSAPQGEFGTVLFDPDNIEIVDGTGIANGDTELGNPVVGTVIAQDNDGGWFTIHEDTLETWDGNANIVLQANNDIIVRNLGGDNTLSFQPGTGTIEFIADADDNGVGQFLMERAGDLIETAGRDLSISAGNRITIESIDTRSTTGGAAGDIRLSAPTEVDIRITLTAGNISLISDGVNFKSANANINGTTLTIATDDPSLNIHLGSPTNNINSLDFEQDEILAIQDGFTNIFIGRADGTGTITLDQSVTDGGANPFQDPVHILGTGTLRIPEQDTTWTITGERQGNLDSLFSNGLSFENINSIVGNATTNDTLQGFTGNDTVELSGINAGTFNGIAFANIENLEGNGGDDNFTFANGAAISGTIDGGTGNNTLDYSAYITDVTISLEDGTAPGTGGISNIQSIIGGGGTNAIQGTNGNDVITLTNVATGSINNIDFQGFDSVAAGDGNDRFLVNDGSWNQLDGGAGNDTLDYSGNPNGITIDLLNQTTDDVALFSGIENFQGSNGVDTLLSTNGDDAIAITANNTGTLGTQTFSDIENIDARGGNDTISFNDGASITGSFTGGNGNDTINYNNYITDLTIDLQTRQTTGIDGGFNTVESFIGGNGNDTFRLDDINPIQTIDGGAGDNTLLGSNTDSIWSLTDVNTGNGPGVGNFSNIQNLTAGNQADQINILANGARFTGELDGAEGLLTLTGDSLGIGTDLRGTGELILQPTSFNRNIRLGGPGLTADLDISTAELSNIRPGFAGITIGRPDGTGRITLGDDVTFSAPVTIQTPNGGGSINSAGYDIEAPEINLSAAQDIFITKLTAANDITLQSSNGVIGVMLVITDPTAPLPELGIEASEITLSAAQDIVTGALAAVNGVTLDSINGVITTGDINATDINLSASQSIVVGALTASNGVALDSNNASIFTQEINAANISLTANQNVVTSHLSAINDITFDSVNGVINTGRLDATDINLSASQNIVTDNITAANDVILDSSNASVILRAVNAANINLTANQDIVTTDLTADNDVNLDSANGVIITQVVNAADIDLSAAENIVTNNLTATNDATLESRNASVITQDINSTDISLFALQNIVTANLTANNDVYLQSDNGTINTQAGEVNADTIDLWAEQDIVTANLTATNGLLLQSDSGSIDTRAGDINTSEIDFLADQDITTANLTVTNDVTLNSNNGAINTQAGEINATRIDLFAAQAITTGNLAATNEVQLQAGEGTINTQAGEINAAEIHLAADQHIFTANLTASGGAATLLSNGIINTQAGEIDAVQIDLYTDQDILTANLKADNDVTLQSSNGAITTQSIDATDVTIAATQAIVTDNLTATDGVTISSDGSVTTTNINTRNIANGGNVTINAGTTITTQQIDTTGITGTGGNVTLNAPSTIQIDSIRAEGDIAGGNVAISTEEFFRATDSFTSLKNNTASISTEANSGTGSITIRHGGNGVTPLEVGNSSILGTNGVITSGTFQIDPNSSFLNSHTLGNIALLTRDLLTPQINVSLPSVGETLPNPPPIRENLDPLDDAASALGAEDYNSQLFERLETSYSEQFKSHLNLYERVNVSPTSLESAKTTLGNVERVLGVKPGVLYVYFLPSKHKHTALPNPDVVNLDDELGLLLLTHEGQTIRKKIEGVTRADVMEVAENFSSQITNSISTASQYLPPAQQLYNWFISPIEEELEEQKIQSLAMVMDTGLRTLPIAALHDGNNFLIERYSLGVIPSFSLTDFNPENFLYTQLDNTQLLAMGASQFPSQQQLPAVPDELEMVTAAFPNSEVFLNDGFTLDNLKNNVSNNNFGIVHLASHGVFEPGAPRNSYIQLWDQHLQLDQVHTLGLDKADIALMVLSACNTAIGDREAEYGFAGLAVNAGVQTSVASLWPISDEGTLGLMTYFYDRLQEQPVRATALRQAQLAMAQGELHFSDGTL